MSRKRRRLVETKVFSVRLPAVEADRIDAQAKASGLNRNDYLRLRLTSQKALPDIRKLDDVIAALRHIEALQDRYLSILEHVLSQLSAQPDTAATIKAEIDRAQDLMFLTLKAQKEAARILKRIRRKIA